MFMFLLVGVEKENQALCVTLVTISQELIRKDRIFDYCTRCRHHLLIKVKLLESCLIEVYT